MDSLVSILPNLSIGVIAVMALVYITIRFIDRMEKIGQAHELAMEERELMLRKVEKDMRGELARLLARSTSVITENTRILAQVIHMLDRR